MFKKGSSMRSGWSRKFTHAYSCHEYSPWVRKSCTNEYRTQKWLPNQTRVHPKKCCCFPWEASLQHVVSVNANVHRLCHRTTAGRWMRRVWLISDALWLFCHTTVPEVDYLFSAGEIWRWYISLCQSNLITAVMNINRHARDLQGHFARASHQVNVASVSWSKERNSSWSSGALRDLVGMSAKRVSCVCEEGVASSLVLEKIFLQSAAVWDLGDICRPFRCSGKGSTFKSPGNRCTFCDQRHIKRPAVQIFVDWGRLAEQLLVLSLEGHQDLAIPCEPENSPHGTAACCTSTRVHARHMQLSFPSLSSASLMTVRIWGSVRGKHYCPVLAGPGAYGVLPKSVRRESS